MRLPKIPLIWAGKSDLVALKSTSLECIEGDVVS